MFQWPCPVITANHTRKYEVVNESFVFHWPTTAAAPPLPRRAAPTEGAPVEWQHLGNETNFCVIFRSSSVHEKQSKFFILTGWIGMGRSGPHNVAKLQLWNCLTLTMVLSCLLLRPGTMGLFSSNSCTYSLTVSPNRGMVVMMGKHSWFEALFWATHHLLCIVWGW